MHIPATDSQHLPDKLQQQQQFLEQLTASFAAGYRASGGQIYCAKGCSNCCNLVVNCSFPEAKLLTDRLEEALLQRIDRYTENLRGLLGGVTVLKDYLRLHRRDSGGCPLLGSDGVCAAYALRPFSCRALLATQESHWCGVDFTGLTSAEIEAFVASLDRAATSFPLHYLAVAQDAGRELERQNLLAMAGECGFSLYGNMAVMVHLISRWGLAGSCSAGADDVRALLQRAGLDHPLLLELEEL